MDIWCVQRRDCFWPSWFSRRTSSPTVVTFSSVREWVFRSVAVVALVDVFFCFPNLSSEVSSPSVSPFILENSVSIVCKLYSLDWYEFLISALLWMLSLLNGMLHPHRGLPPWRGGRAYAPTTRTICNLKERSLLRADHMIRTTILHVTSAKWLVNFRLHSRFLLHRLLWPLLHRGCALGRTDTASALGRCNNLHTPEVR